ncbi:hypothetical protein [Shimia ponticola]|uniref:hypothetical protein n=1 Tax=Shimia ponticola TaxID=2582893 RepID=UPI0011BE89B6|nr:hypothetical protein [Shimia ponticola]
MVVGWLGLLVGVTLISDAAPAVLVLFPNDDLISTMAADVAILDATRFSVTLASTEGDLARRLYQNGSFIVLPARMTGCI